MMEKFRKSALTWIVLLIFYFGMQYFQDRELASGVPPAIEAMQLDGKPFPGLDSLPKPALVYFWGSWCPICSRMRGTISNAARDVPIITVAMESGNAAEVQAYENKENFQVPTVLDESGHVARSWGLRGVPAIFIIGRDGKIKSSTIGYTTNLGLRWRLWLARY